MSLFSLILKSNEWFESRPPLVCVMRTTIQLEKHFLYDEDRGFLNWLQVGIYLSQRLFMCLCVWVSNMIPSVGLEVQHLGNCKTENPGNSKTCFVHWMNSLKIYVQLLVLTMHRHCVFLGSLLDRNFETLAWLIMFKYVNFEIKNATEKQPIIILLCWENPNQEH